MFEHVIQPVEVKPEYALSLKLANNPTPPKPQPPKPLQPPKPKFKVYNWFTRLVDQRGEDYIFSGKLTADEVNRGVGRIIDDIIYGRIDYVQQGKYLLQPSVIDTLLAYCHNKLAISYARQYAIGCAYNTSIPIGVGNNLDQAKFIVEQDIYIYGVLYNRLAQAKFTNNAIILCGVSGELNVHRRSLRVRY